MKILICTRAFPPQIGGQETIVMLLAEGLARQTRSNSNESFEVTVATPTSANGMNDTALPFHVVREPGFFSLFRLFRQTDIVHLAGAMMMPMILALLLRKPVVIEHHGFQPICPNGQLLYNRTQSLCPGHFMAGRYGECIRCNADLGILQSVKMWLLTFPRRWLCQQVTANLLPTEWLGSLLRLNRMETIVHGLRAPDASTTVIVVDPVPTFVFVGRLVNTKGVRILLEATRQMKARGLLFRVKIIGEGPDRESLEIVTRDLEIQQYVQFFGYVAQDELAGILGKASAIIMPSLAGEVFGLSAAENMLNGRLVIASDIGSLSEVIGDSGMTFPPGDSTALGILMAEVIANPSVIEKFGEMARRRMSRDFNLERMVHEHCLLYRRILSS